MRLVVSAREDGDLVDGWKLIDSSECEVARMEDGKYFDECNTEITKEEVIVKLIDIAVRCEEASAVIDEHTSRGIEMGIVNMKLKHISVSGTSPSRASSVC